MVWRAGSSRVDPPESHRIREDPMRGSLRCARIPSIRVLAEYKRIEPNRFDPPESDRIRKNPIRFTHFCLGSVDTRSGQVDTSPRFQKTQLPDWDSRSTLDQSRSTLAQGRSILDPVSSRLVLQKWDSRSTLVQGRSTHSGNSVT
ncbi:hypothetical protein Taro_007576 [Colocasia esculenta]|uniref:Uncharacterized protein n=1 Tax=Colocasia esculenta TaxID=4460 RepID=A0A843U004_COLES|nr:hypothetical protein [Colocasia esculenta]